MYPLNSFRTTLLKATSIFQKLGIPFHLTGGVTSIAYSEPRMTQDVDIVISNKGAKTHLESLLEELEKAEFILSRDKAVNAVEYKKMFQILDDSESLKLDIYPRELIPGELERSVTFELFEGVQLPFASKVDLALSKLVWVSKGSHKSRRDIRRICDTCSEEEKERIQLFSKKMDLNNLLVQVLKEPDEILY